MRARRKSVVCEPALDIRVKLEEPHAIGDGGAALADLLRDVLLAKTEFAREPRESEGLFDRVQVLALQIFDEREFEHFLVRCGADDCRGLGEADFAAARQRRSPAMNSYLSIRFRTISGWMIPCSRMGIDQLAECLRLEFGARLERRGEDVVELDALDVLAQFGHRCWRSDAM